MEDVSFNDTPKREEIVDRFTGEAFAGEFEPMTVALLPLRNLGKVHASVSDLAGPGGRFRPRRLISVMCRIASAGLLLREPFTRSPRG